MRKADGADKDIRKLLDTLSRAGCNIKQTSNGHWRVTRPGASQITVASKVGDRRGLRNAKADVRRYLGIEL